MDVNKITLSQDFVRELEAALSQCAAMVVVIGNSWLMASRLSDPNDYVRMEIEAALRRNIGIFPVLVGGARMPGPTDLPESIVDFSRRQSHAMSNDQFKSGMGGLVAALEQVLGG
jgi:hypothetical protein